MKKLVYMADIFKQIKESNWRMQGYSENVLTNKDKLNRIKSELQLWR